MPVVPTSWVEQPGPVHLDGEVVVKPAISGGGHQTARYRPHEHEAAGAHIDDLVAAGRVAMVQPYQAAVDREGEVGLIFLGGTFSHAIHKEPMIRHGAGPLDSLIDNQVVVATTPAEDQLALGRRAVAAAEALMGPSTYARVDSVARDGGRPPLARARAARPAALLRLASRQGGRLRPGPGGPARGGRRETGPLIPPAAPGRPVPWWS